MNAEPGEGRIRRELREMREGARVLCSREFWRGFFDYWSAESISARMDDWVSRVRENTGQEPDWKVERRRWARRKKRDANER